MCINHHTNAITSTTTTSQLALEQLPNEFIIVKPVQKENRVYNEFLTFLYRHDALKGKARRRRDVEDIESVKRSKRMLVFR
jgi:hypothetical protein